MFGVSAGEYLKANAWNAASSSYVHPPITSSWANLNVATPGGFMSSDINTTYPDGTEYNRQAQMLWPQVMAHMSWNFQQFDLEVE